jgi:hypothetical protein
MDQNSQYLIWHLSFNSNLDIGVRVPKVVRDIPSSDGAGVYIVSSSYPERINKYVPDKQISHLTFDRELWPWPWSECALNKYVADVTCGHL